MAFAFFSFLRSLFQPRAAARALSARTDGAERTVRPARARPPVRVVHKGPGRLVISGRLADVCAELDRLAALEAAQPAFAPTR